VDFLKGSNVDFLEENQLGGRCSGLHNFGRYYNPGSIKCRMSCSRRPLNTVIGRLGLSPDQFTETLTVVVCVMEPLVPVTVTAYVPAVVPPTGDAGGLCELPPPHPMVVPARARRNTSPSRAFPFRVRRGTQRNIATVRPPAMPNRLLAGRLSAAVVGAVVFTVRLAVAA
jgi:hypothetical protein